VLSVLVVRVGVLSESVVVGVGREAVVLGGIARSGGACAVLSGAVLVGSGSELIMGA